MYIYMYKKREIPKGTPGQGHPSGPPNSGPVPPDFRMNRTPNLVYKEVAQTRIIPKRIFATNRVAGGRIRTALRRSNAGPFGHVLGPFRAPKQPGGKQQQQQQQQTTIFI